MPVIEQRLASGVSQLAVVETLVEHGVVLSLVTFRTYLKRWRSRQGTRSKSRVGASIGVPALEPIAFSEREEISANKFQNKGDIARARNENDIDLNALAKIGHQIKRRS